MVNTDICEGWRWKYEFNKVGGTWPLLGRALSGCTNSSEESWASQWLAPALPLTVLCLLTCAY